jgi:hypothetical protein
MVLNDIAVESISFDWHDDYSSWRLEDISTEIDEALAIFNKYNLPIEKPDNVYQLSEFSKKVRVLYKDEKISDFDARRAMILGDLLFFNDETASFDTEIAYNDAIEMLREILPKWESKFDLCCNNQESVTDLTVLLDSILHKRDGLGDRWEFEFYDDFISFPDGTTIKGFIFDKENDREFVDLLEYNYSGIDNYKDIFTKFQSLEPALKSRAKSLLLAISDKNQSISNEVIDFVFALVEANTVSNDLVFLSNFENLFTEWQLSLYDLIKVSAGLT